MGNDVCRQGLATSQEPSHGANANHTFIYGPHVVVRYDAQRTGRLLSRGSDIRGIMGRPIWVAPMIYPGFDGAGFRSREPIA